ncbi:MAG: amidohydrolase family protein [Rhodospirillaceae bacterium]|nr:amidohydrolase family protein [Rhodospirillaceae bacterium]
MPPNPRLVAGPGACDTHMHIYDSRFPLAPTASFTPPEAPVAAYLAMRRRIGIERTVVVQPSGYGFDNRCTLEAMAAMGPSARGVAVVGADVAEAELDGLTRAGMRGVRYFMLPGGVLPWDSLAPVAAKVHAFGWHVQLQMDGRLLAEREEQLLRLPGRLVIDHNGKFLEPVAVDHPGFRCLLRLLDTGRAWVKVSAPYETSKTGAPRYADVGVLAKALIRAAPERMLWATNWPHPSVPRERMPDDADLLDLLLDWAPSDAVRRRILADNPAELYGFA